MTQSISFLYKFSPTPKCVKYKKKKRKVLFSKLGFGLIKKIPRGFIGSVTECTAAGHGKLCHIISY